MIAGVLFIDRQGWRKPLAIGVASESVSYGVDAAEPCAGNQSSVPSCVALAG